MTNIGLKIATGATVLGLGGLAGYALGSNDGIPSTPAATPAAHVKPKVRTHVVHRTIHVRPDSRGTEASGPPLPATPSRPAAAAPPSPAPAAPAAAPVPSSAPAVQVSNPAPAPVSTHSSGGAAGGNLSGYGDDEGEGSESEAADD